MALKKAEAEHVTINRLKEGTVKVLMIGLTPLYFNSMSVKAMRTLLIGGGRKTAAEKQELKHNPEEEFEASVYKLPDGPTLLGFPAPAVSAAMGTAALATPGVTKANVQRLVSLHEYRIKIWGKPFLKMDVVRSADMNHTPDIRTRAILPRWGAEVELNFITPTLNAFSVISLLANAGTICGIGDWRKEKGGMCGCWDVATADNLGKYAAQWAALMKEGRDVQTRALENPEPADEDTEDLLEFLNEVRVKRAA